jgi:hypothetical protein
VSATSGLEVKIDRMKEVLSALDSFSLESVYVGVPEETADKRAADESGKSAKINNAQLARIHEYGAPAASIPPRPFLEPGIMDAHDEIVADLQEGAEAALDTLNPKELNKALNKAGMHAVRKVKEKFTDNDWPPLSDLTIGGLNKRKDGEFSLNDEDFLWKGRKKTKKMQEEYVMLAAFGESLDAIRDQYKPLIDTGSLRRSITYVVRKKGE